MEIQVATTAAAAPASELQVPPADEGSTAGLSPSGGSSLSTHAATPLQAVPAAHGLQATQADDSHDFHGNDGADPLFSTPAPADVTQADDVHDNDVVDSLFSTPAPAVLRVLPGKPARQRRTFNMTKVRRSARLAKKPAMPAVERAQRNLWRKLGVSDDEFRPIEEILQEFIAMFSGPLPGNIVDAMTALFGLDDDDDILSNALIEHAGEAADDLQQDSGPAST